MSDIERITDVIVRYATGIDMRDWNLFRTCFTEDCKFDYGPLGVWEGAEFITQYMMLAHSGPSLHRLTNIAINVDGNAAKARTYVDALVFGPVSWLCAQMTGYYEDDLINTADGWKITQRRHISVSMKFKGILGVVPSSLVSYMSVIGSRKMTAAARKKISRN
jgi:hypothetical protein